MTELEARQTDRRRPSHGNWQWHADAGELHVRIVPGDPMRDLAGKWTLDAFGVQLDGLSRARLFRAFQGTGDGALACALGLSDGRRVRLVGAFDEDGGASGDLLMEVDPSLAHARPGPVLAPVYQPIISLRTGRTAGFEALARWTGTLDASDSTFEDPALATNMLIHAAQALSDWQTASGQRSLFVQVNVTGRDLVAGDVATLVETLRQGYDLPEGCLKIELTEQAALRDMTKALTAVRAIKAAGAGLVLDDFGSGHSSFAWLADMPADALKVDHGLTRRLGDARTEHILEAITLLAGRLGMTVTAEGVEDKATVARLRGLGFTHVQGFAFARPMEAAEATAFLARETENSGAPGT